MSRNHSPRRPPMFITSASRLTHGIVTTAALLLLAGAPQPASAQHPRLAAAVSTSSAETTPVVRRVTVIMLTTLPQPGGRAVVIRRRLGTPAELIVLPERGATGADLASALSALADARELHQGGLKAPQERISIRGGSFADAAGSPAEQHFDALVDRLRRAPTRTIEGVGSGPVITISQAVRTRP